MIREILEKLLAKKISIEEAEKLLKLTAIEEIENMVKLDIGRELRAGVPEIILAEGKHPDILIMLIKRALEKKGRVIISRLQKEHLDAIKKSIFSNAIIEIREKAKVAVIKKKNYKVKKTGGKVGIITAGTADIPVAEEARAIVEEMGCETITIYDVGVAGIHRLFHSLKDVIEKDVDVLIVIAGREGALPSIIAGMTDIPVIGVPTSSGYGFGEKGLSALAAMLQSCSLGLAIVNIDNGAGAGAIAALIANRVARFREMRKEKDTK